MFNNLTLSSKRAIRGLDHFAEVEEYFNNVGFERWNKIYSESDEVNKVQLDIRTGHAVTVDKVLGWVDEAPFTATLAELGLATLFFMAGSEIEFSAIAGRPLVRAALGWVLSLGGGIAVGLLLAPTFPAAVIIAIALSSTALGTLIPVLRDAGFAWSDVVKINAFVADDSSEALGIYCGLLKEYLTTHAGREAVAHTYVTVSALALPGVLIEIEGVAIRET